jgi:hypothetical protein
MKLHYFDKERADPDMRLEMAKHQGYVPQTCLLAGGTVMAEVNAGRDPCAGCQGPRERCKGRPRKPS